MINCVQRFGTCMPRIHFAEDCDCGALRMSAQRIVLFGLGNVLVRINIRNFWKTLGLEQPDGALAHRDEISLYPEISNPAIERKRMSSASSIAFPGKRFSDRELEAAFNSILSPSDQRNGRSCASGFFRLFDRTRQQHETRFIMNRRSPAGISCSFCPALSFIQAALRWKPDEAYYKAVLQDLQLRPGTDRFSSDDLEKKR